LLIKFLKLVDRILGREPLVAAGVECGLFDVELDMMRFVYLYVTWYRVYMEQVNWRSEVLDAESMNRRWWNRKV
jgi:hypothetical protein